MFKSKRVFKPKGVFMEALLKDDSRDVMKFLMARFLSLFRPEPEDRKIITMPRSMEFLYLLVKPLRRFRQLRLKKSLQHSLKRDLD